MKRQLTYCLLIATCGVLFWLGLISQKPATSLAKDAQILHTLNRLSFGPTVEEIEQVKTKGIESFIQSQLSPGSIPESSQLTSYLGKLDTLAMSPIELFQQYSPSELLKDARERNLSKEEINRLRRKRKIVKEQAINAHLARAVNSPRQLQEIMVDFWLSHFNVYGQKNLTDLWIADYENEIRENALGNFRDLLEITARHPAMLVYLDNELNTDPNSPGARGKHNGLNENYARELMELHTLGVDGGYTQADVIALARILTGWGIDRQQKFSSNENGFFFFEKRHDYGDKVFLGQTIKGSGIAEGEQALELLATHPATARFLSYKLAQYFVADQPPSSLVDKLSQKFLASSGDLKQVLDTLFHSKEFNDPQYYGKKFKTPYQYLVSVVRVSNIKNPDYKRLRGMLSQLGMPVYGCATPDGYKNTQSAWLNPDGMLNRVSLATAIARGVLTKKEPVSGEKLEKIIGKSFSQHTKQVINQNSARMRAALMLGSPEMMYR
ncbi:hypothetical protein STA3757_09350 [Stanieria sp. NIES-3757]|nr:hypothetical protein STA3757_09350 [Stanieria sp. NIES-3757]